MKVICNVECDCEPGACLHRVPHTLGKNCGLGYCGWAGEDGGGTWCVKIEQNATTTVQTVMPG